GRGRRLPRPPARTRPAGPPRRPLDRGRPNPPRTPERTPDDRIIRPYEGANSMTNTPTPTGRLVPTGDGHDLVLTRILPGSLDDAWAGVTEPERTARWIGRWEGTGAVGETIKLRLGFEDDAPVSDVKITECAAPHRLRVLTIDESGSWDVSLTLAPVGERTELTFTMHRVDP